MIKYWYHSHTIHGTGILYLHEWLIFMVNVGKYTSPMDCMGYIIGIVMECFPDLLSQGQVRSDFEMMNI